MNVQEAGQRSPALIEQLLAVWERSVRATHTFLSEAEILRIRAYVPEALAQVPLLVTAQVFPGRPAAFMGLDGGSLEMLFVDPEARGQGIGGQLVRRGIRRYGLDRVCVNEQNPQALGFYRHMGFQVYRRTERDQQGGPYPLLYMRLPESRGAEAGGVCPGGEQPGPGAAVRGKRGGFGPAGDL